MPLSEHVYCVAIAFTMTEEVEQWICISFLLAHSSTETTGVLQKATAAGNWGSAASSRQCTCIVSPAEIFGETSNHPGESAPLQPRFGTLWLLAFPKTTITFEREEISDPQWDSKKYNGAADGDSSKGFCRVFWTILCIMFLVSCVFFNKCLFFVLHDWTF